MAVSGKTKNEKGRKQAVKKKTVSGASAAKTSSGKLLMASAKSAKSAKSVKSVKKAATAKPAGKTLALKKAVVKKPVLAKTRVVRKGVAANVVKLKKKPQEKISPEKTRLQTLRQSLNEKRDSIVKEAKKEIAKYVSGEHRQLVDTALDDGDWAVVDISEDLNLLRLAAHRKTMIEIDEALRKIGEGTYGICEECGEEISEKRLSVLPAATMCVSCKETREQFEAIDREETT